MHHSTIFFFGVLMQAKCIFFALAILDSANSANWGSERANMGVSCAPQHHFFSAFSCRRNATFCPCIPGFCPFWFSPFDVFFWRAQRFLDPLVFISFQGAAAAAAGRGSPPPPGARRASVVGLIRVLAASFGHDEVKRARGGRGLV